MLKVMLTAASLNAAYRRQDIKTVKTILKEKPELFDKTKEYATYIASKDGKLVTLRFLLNQGASVNGGHRVHNHFLSNLYVAAKEGQMSVVKELVKRNVKLNDDKEHHNPVYIALKRKDATGTAIANYLLNHGASRKAAIAAAKRNNKKYIVELLS